MASVYETLGLLNGGGFHYCLEVPVDHLFMRVVRLGQAAQKHCRGGNVLVRPSKVWGIIPPIHGVVLDPMGTTPSAARRPMRTGRNEVRRAWWRNLWLMQPPLS